MCTEIGYKVFFINIKVDTIQIYPELVSFVYNDGGTVRVNMYAENLFGVIKTVTKVRKGEGFLTVA